MGDKMQKHASKLYILGGLEQNTSKQATIIYK